MLCFRNMSQTSNKHSDNVLKTVLIRSQYEAKHDQFEESQKRVDRSAVSLAAGLAREDSRTILTRKFIGMNKVMANTCLRNVKMHRCIKFPNY